MVKSDEQEHTVFAQEPPKRGISDYLLLRNSDFAQARVYKFADPNNPLDENRLRKVYKRILNLPFAVLVINFARNIISLFHNFTGPEH